MVGQELNDESYAICKADMLIKGQDVRQIKPGDTLANDGHAGESFDYMLSNPPFGVEWKQSEKAVRREHEQQGFNGRFGPGLPRISDGSLLFMLHLVAKMRPVKDGGARFIIVQNGSPLFTGGAESGESEVRRHLLENDLVEAIVALPTEMFYNTGIFTDSFTHDGDFALIGRQGALCGNVNYARGQFWASEHAVVAEPLKAYPLRWFGELLRAMKLGQYSIASAQPGLAVEVIRNLLVPVPPDEEKQRISAFLDQETAKIDALIEEQRRLIELLKEKRQAFISRAVTRGLDTSVTMTPSGKYDESSLPAHWRTKKVKHIISEIEQGWSPRCDNFPAEGEEWGVLKVGAVNSGVLDPVENKRLPLDIEPEERLGIRKDDVLISRANTRELVGSAAIATEDNPRRLLCDKIYRLKVNASACLAGFLTAFLRTSLIRGVIEGEASGASQSMQNISQDAIRNLSINLPPLKEQAWILSALDAQMQDLEALSGEAEKATALLQERRSALISAAVTGKIDVRNYRPQEFVTAEETT
jgi:type I restriction enzyme S subunit